MQTIFMQWKSEGQQQEWDACILSNLLYLLPWASLIVWHCSESSFLSLFGLPCLPLSHPPLVTLFYVYLIEFLSIDRWMLLGSIIHEIDKKFNLLWFYLFIVGFYKIIAAWDLRFNWHFFFCRYIFFYSSFFKVNCCFLLQGNERNVWKANRISLKSAYYFVTSLGQYFIMLLFDW